LNEKEDAPNQQADKWGGQIEKGDEKCIDDGEGMERQFRRDERLTFCLELRDATVSMSHHQTKWANVGC
jgi:hypothetical protein